MDDIGNKPSRGWRRVTYEIIFESETPAGEALPVRVDKALLRNEAVQEIFRQVVEKANQVFDPHEQVKQFRLLDEALTLEKDELTPTLKVKKEVIQQKYAHLLREIYAS